MYEVQKSLYGAYEFQICIYYVSIQGHCFELERRDENLQFQVQRGKGSKYEIGEINKSSLLSHYYSEIMYVWEGVCMCVCKGQRTTLCHLQKVSRAL